MANIMEAVSLYRRGYRVEVDHVDFNGNLKLSSLFTYFQDIAGFHAENLGMGMKALYEEQNALWVLARIRVDIIRYPLWNEEVIINTWPQEPNRMEFIRDFLMRDKDGNILAKAVSTWVIIDAKTRRLKRTKSVYTGYPSLIEERAIACRLGRLKPDGPLEVVHNRTVGYSDIDFNRHLNNSKYVDFIMDCFSIDDHKKYEIETIEVNYSREALPGDSIAIYRDMHSSNSDMIYLEGINQKNDKLTFKAEMRFRPK